MHEKVIRRGAGYLLDDLAQTVGCDYLSDLKSNLFYRYPLYLAMPGFPADEYSLGEWNEAVGYILGQPARFDSVKEAHGFLQRALAEYTRTAEGQTVPQTR